jgi:hypothetical protein
MGRVGWSDIESRFISTGLHFLARKENGNNNDNLLKYSSESEKIGIITRKKTENTSELLNTLE